MEKLSFNYPYLFSYLDFFVPSTKGRTKKDILFLSYPKKRLIDGSDIGKTGLMTNIHNGKIRRKKKLFCLFSHGILYIILKRHPHMLFISSNLAQGGTKNLHVKGVKRNDTGGIQTGYQPVFRMRVLESGYGMQHAGPGQRLCMPS